jgi:hypothetical protein
MKIIPLPSLSVDFFAAILLFNDSIQHRIGFSDARERQSQRTDGVGIGDGLVAAAVNPREQARLQRIEVLY